MADKMESYIQPEINIYHCEYITDCSYWTFNNVSAPYWRFYWNATLGGEIRYKKETIILRPDSIILIPPNTCFSTKAHNAFKQFHVHFTAAPPFNQVRQNIYTFPTSEDIKEKILALKKIIPLEQDKMHFKLILFSLIYDALLKIPQNAFIANKKNTAS